MLPRKIIKELLKYIKSDEFFLLVGARQVGKTTILKMLQEYVTNELKTPVFYFDMEDFKYLADFNEDPKNIFAYVPKDSEQKIYIFIDEIQYLNNPSHFIKYLFDHHKKNIKIICTGSASLEIKSKLQDSLVGRIYNFFISPLTFEEFFIFKNTDVVKWDLSHLTLMQKKELETLLEEFLIFGGMPAVVLKQTKEEKQKLLENYVRTYVQKDIRSITTINDITKYNFLMRILANQISNLLNINNIAKNLQISFPTVKRYIEILELTYIITLIHPYLLDINKQIRKMPKMFFYDTGIRNALINNFDNLKVRNDSGALFENMIANELKYYDHNHLFYYRTKMDAEIDFVFEKNDIYLIKTKFKNLLKPEIPKIFSSITHNYKKIKKIVINKSFSSKKDDVIFLPFYKLLEIFL